MDYEVEELWTVAPVSDSFYLWVSKGDEILWSSLDGSSQPTYQTQGQIILHGSGSGQSHAFTKNNLIPWFSLS